MPESFHSSSATTSDDSSTSTFSERMHVFVTVGSTRFDALVQKVLSEPVLDVLRAKGYRTLDVQCGNSDFDASQLSRSADDHWQRAGDLETSVWRFKPTLKEDYERADLIISHAGNVCLPHMHHGTSANQPSPPPHPFPSPQAPARSSTFFGSGSL